jgi:hypothetical protein
MAVLGWLLPLWALAALAIAAALVGLAESGTLAALGGECP